MREEFPKSGENALNPEVLVEAGTELPKKKVDSNVPRRADLPWCCYYLMKALKLLFAISSQTGNLTTNNNSIMSATKSLAIDPFCYRQFAEHEAASKSPYGGTVFSNSVEEFTAICNQRYAEEDLKEGYAPFCKHLFVINDFTDAKVNVLEITKENEHLLRSKYEARNDKELPVLTRSFPRELLIDEKPLPTAKYLDLILYSRDQINKENDAQGDAGNPETAPWGIVSIKAQDADFELPMTPMTAMRNALGKEEGGSGIPINRESYMEAFNYWNDHANIS